MKRAIWFALMAILTMVMVISCGKESATEPPDNPPPSTSGHWGTPIHLGSQFTSCWSPSITSDGKTIYFSRDVVVGQYYRYEAIFTSTIINGVWSAPEQLFKGVSPSISWDGNSLYYLSQPDSIFVITKSGGKWGTPVYLLSGNDPCISKDGKTLYFSSESGGWRLASASYQNGKWTKNGFLPGILFPEGSFDPSISADGTTLYFAHSEDPGYDIYRAIYSGGSWSIDIKLDATINFAKENYTPCISWDGKKLYYSTWDPTLDPDGIYVSSWIPD